MLRLSKFQKDNILEALNKAARNIDSFEYGLPIIVEAQAALMRETIDEALEIVEDAKSEFKDILDQENIECTETIERNRSKEGDYTDDECPNCGRSRIMKGDDKKRRCEKCAWCIEDNIYDYDYLEFIK